MALLCACLVFSFAFRTATIDGCGMGFTISNPRVAFASILAASSALGALCVPASADLVSLDQSASVTGTSTVMTAKYRYSKSNFDQSLDNGVGTSGSNFISSNWGDNVATANRSFSFTLENRVGEGFVWTIGDAAASKTLGWGTFAGGLPAGATSAATLNRRAPGGAFNALRIEARAGLSGATLSFGSLVFSSATLGITGAALADGSVSNSNGLTGATRLLTADTDLSRHNWTLSGTFTGFRSNSSSSDENVRLQVLALNGTVVPAPGALAFAALALAGPSRRRRS